MRQTKQFILARAPRLGGEERKEEEEEEEEEEEVGEEKIYMFSFWNHV